jgi:protein-S-isoprenylcysteine O-methyltransferase Ste14
VKAEHGEHPAGDAGQVVALGVFLVVWGIDSFLLHKSTFFAGHVPLFVRVSALIAALVIAMALVRAGHSVIDHEKGPTRVMSSGAFGYVRHPLYLGCILFYVGLFFLTLSLFSLGLLVTIFIFYDVLASYEERFLERKFRDDYRAYRAKTGKWLPKLRKA